MTHMLKKLPRPNISSSSHQYQQVPLDAESDSEDDEALLYAAPGLNQQHNGVSSKQDNNFGVGVYDHSCDLDLPRIVQLPEKGRKKPRAGAAAQRLMRSKVFACIFVLLAALLVAVIAAFAVLVAGNWDYFGPASNTSCTQVPKPLIDGKPPCTESQQITSAPTPTAGLQDSSLTAAPSEQPLSLDQSDNSLDAAATQPEVTSKSMPPVRMETTGDGSQKPTISSIKDLTAAEDDTITTKSSPSESSIESTDAAMSSSSSSSSDTVATTRGTDELPTVHSEDAGPEFEVEIITDDEESTSCTPVPSPLPSGQVSPQSSSAMHSLLLEPSPLADDSEHNIEEHVMVGEPTMETTKSTMADRPTPAVTETQEQEGNSHHTQMVKTETEGKLTASSDEDRLYWERKFRPAASEATPKVCDLDGDETEERLLVEDYEMSTVRVHAMNGLNGSTIWKQTVNFPVFGLRCFMDINNDGRLDVFISGRGGGFGALSGADGSVLWFVDKSVIFPPYNFYFPQRVPDMDRDGVDDLINTHGGDSSYGPEELDRSPGYLIVVSGRTGQKLLDPIPMPDGKETYMSPILFSVNGANTVVLLGTGGETVPGSLWGVELASLQNIVAFYLKEYHEVYEVNFDDTYHPWGLQQRPPRPKADSSQFDLDHSGAHKARDSCPTWGSSQVPIWNYYDVCLYEFVRTEEKGVILPPVVVDVTSDGVDDLVVSTFDGHTIALDGQNVKNRIWDTSFPGTESYSIPAPLFYTPDDVPDFLVRSSIGTWAEGYVQSSLHVLDGKDGGVLWTHNSSIMGMMSTISFMSRTHGRDAMVFYAVDVYTGGYDNNDDDTGEVGGPGGEGVAPPPPPPVQVATSTRRRRHDHDGGGHEAVMGGEGEHGEALELQNGEERGGDGEPKGGMDYQYDLIHESMVHTDPPELWKSNGDFDDLPNPLTLDAYLLYCGETTISLYLVNREMVESGMELKPLMQYRPIIYFPPGSSPIVPDSKNQSTRIKRHGGSEPHEEGPSPAIGPDGLPIEEPQSEEEMRHKLNRGRCSHLAYPNMVVGTPLLTDLDADGRQDVTYDIVWSPKSASPPQILAVGADLELLFERVYGKGILDFSTFVSPKDQPWTQYMGKNADSVYKPPVTT